MQSYTVNLFCKPRFYFGFLSIILLIQSLINTLGFFQNQNFFEIAVQQEVVALNFKVCGKTGNGDHTWALALHSPLTLKLSLF